MIMLRGVVMFPCDECGTDVEGVAREIRDRRNFCSQLCEDAFDVREALGGVPVEVVGLMKMEGGSVAILYGDECVVQEIEGDNASFRVPRVHGFPIPITVRARKAGWCPIEVVGTLDRESDGFGVHVTPVKDPIVVRPPG